MLQFSSAQLSSVVQSCPTLCDPMNHSTPGLPVYHQLPESTQTHVHWVGDAIQSPHPLSSPSPPALNLSQHQGLFQWVSSSHQVDKVLEFQFSFNISPSNECPGLISFRMDWLDLLAVPRDSQESSPGGFPWGPVVKLWAPNGGSMGSIPGWGTKIPHAVCPINKIKQLIKKSLLQHHSSKALILWHSAFFIVQLSHPYMTIGKTIALTQQNFVDKVMSLLVNMLSRLVITFLPRSQCLLISWLH